MGFGTASPSVYAVRAVRSRKTPALELCIVDREQAERIAALRNRYQVQFALRMSAATSVNNHEYPDVLDRGRHESAMGRPRICALQQECARALLVEGSLDKKFVFISKLL
jgi:hypothetical protein